MDRHAATKHVCSDQVGPDAAHWLPRRRGGVVGVDLRLRRGVVRAVGTPAWLAVAARQPARARRRAADHRGRPAGAQRGQVHRRQARRSAPLGLPGRSHGDRGRRRRIDGRNGGDPRGRTQPRRNLRARARRGRARQGRSAQRGARRSAPGHHRGHRCRRRPRSELHPRAGAGAAGRSRHRNPRGAGAAGDAPARGTHPLGAAQLALVARGRSPGQRAGVRCVLRGAIAHRIDAAVRLQRRGHPLRTACQRGRLGRAPVPPRHCQRAARAANMARVHRLSPPPRRRLRARAAPRASRCGRCAGT